MAERFVDRQSSGTVPELRDFWKIAVSDGDISSASSLRILAGIMSGPQALFGFILLNSFATPSSVTMMSGIGEQGSPLGCGLSIRTVNKCCCRYPHLKSSMVVWIESNPYMIFLFMKINYYVKKIQQDTGAETSHKDFQTKVGVQITSVAQLTDQSSPKTFNLSK